MKPQTVQVLRRVLLAYSVPMIFFDLTATLALYNIYYLPFFPLNATNSNDFPAVLTTALIMIFVTGPGVFGGTFVNRKWRSLKKAGLA